MRNTVVARLARTLGLTSTVSHYSDSAECSDCGQPLVSEATEAEVREPCPSCGSTRQTINVSIVESVVARDGLALKAKRPGQKKPYVETISMPSHSRRTGKVVHRERLIDRDNNRYEEKVTDYETGEIIHHQAEPLSEHVGHGSAKLKKTPDEA